MLNEKQERWKALCAQASKEQDPVKLSELMAEIDRMLQEKQDRLTGPRSVVGRQEVDGPQNRQGEGYGVIEHAQPQMRLLDTAE
jgi:hypothetical protein